MDKNLNMLDFIRKVTRNQTEGTKYSNTRQNHGLGLILTSPQVRHNIGGENIQ